jgi:hypothetical protein
MNRIDYVERELDALVAQHLRDWPLSEEELDRLTSIMQRTLDSAARDHKEEHLSPENLDRLKTENMLKYGERDLDEEEREHWNALTARLDALEMIKIAADCGGSCFAPELEDKYHDQYTLIVHSLIRTAANLAIRLKRLRAGRPIPLSSDQDDFEAIRVGTFKAFNAPLDDIEELRAPDPQDEGRKLGCTRSKANTEI